MCIFAVENLKACLTELRQQYRSVLAEAKRWWGYVLNH